jgi:DNA-binding transcriptional ArsR family regulator
MTANKSQKAQDALFAIFASTARVAVLRVFVLDPVRTYYQRQIESATGLPIRAVQRELERFAQVGLLYRRSEGNRAYYQVDTQFALFAELRQIFLKMAEPVERLRGLLAVEPFVRMVFLDEAAGRVLVVTSGDEPPQLSSTQPFAIEAMSLQEFARVLSEDRERLEPYLARGVDLLGRREDVIWRRIEASGYSVKKGKGVP